MRQSLMSTHSIHFLDKIRKNFPKIFQNICFELSEELLGTQKWVWINHAKWAIGVWSIVVLLYLQIVFFYELLLCLVHELFFQSKIDNMLQQIQNADPTGEINPDSTEMLQLEGM